MRDHTDQKPSYYELLTQVRDLQSRLSAAESQLVRVATEGERVTEKLKRAEAVVEAVKEAAKDSAKVITMWDAIRRYEVDKAADEAMEQYKPALDALAKYDEEGR